MKRFLLSLALLLGFLSPAIPQLMSTDIGGGGFGSGSVPPIIAFTGSQNTSVGAINTVTFSAITIAPGLVVVVVYNLDSLANPVISATLNAGGGPVAMTFVADASSGSAIEASIFQLTVASGTSAIVAVTYTGAVNTGTSALDAYSITGLLSSTPTTLQVDSGGSNVTSLNGNLASTSGGVAVVGAIQRTANSSTGVISGVTFSGPDRNCFQIAGFSCATTDHASGLSTATNSITATWNGSERSVLVGGAWR